MSKLTKTQHKTLVDNLLDEAIELGAKYQVQYADYADTQWTAPVLLTEDRIKWLTSDNSITKIRVEFKT